ncbi:hypothetical protein [Yinghuangia seranimata]|uniref:hypothetical protein n=1 Tax=Yinghuangia seranimata TaxID=408067 RepID=UPI00248C1980|nr:hypothetical protein [Yinghuangia seranimata]MDI2129080.1 hypothetical protein [Yinghuangia seranimata]
MVSFVEAAATTVFSARQALGWADRSRRDAARQSAEAATTDPRVRDLLTEAEFACSTGA